MRAPGSLRVTAVGDREVAIVRTFDAPRRLVFEAHTNPELVRRWLLGPPGWAMVVCEIDLRVGGAYRYLWRNVDGTQMGLGGIHREIVVPERIVATQIFDDDWTGGEALSTLVLTERDGRTTLTNTMRYSSRAARDAVLETPMEQGLAAGYDRLATVLAAAAA
jgi:uncharacterized protein YndB with AHSA1/START domain